MSTSDDVREQISAPRYSRFPFPPYRYLSGRHPHPTAHPKGHSYRPPGSPPHEVIWYPPERWRESPDYLYGCDLYNHAYWWEAHEAWEGLWQLTDKKGFQGQFLQGLIQAAACHLKLHTQHMEGVKRLQRTSVAYLQAVVEAGMEGPAFMGLRVALFAANVRAYWNHLVEMHSSLAHDTSSFPYIDLSGDEP